MEFNNECDEEAILHALEEGMDLDQVMEMHDTVSPNTPEDDMYEEFDKFVEDNDEDSPSHYRSIAATSNAVTDKDLEYVRTTFNWNYAVPETGQMFIYKNELMVVFLTALPVPVDWVRISRFSSTTLIVHKVAFNVIEAAAPMIRKSRYPVRVNLRTIVTAQQIPNGLILEYNIATIPKYMTISGEAGVGYECAIVASKARTTRTVTKHATNTHGRAYINDKKEIVL